MAKEIAGLDFIFDLDRRGLDSLLARVDGDLEDVVEIAGRNIEGRAKSIIIRDDIIDTGATLNSVESRTAGKLEREIGPTTEYAPYLELGTSRMPARPFMVPAKEAEEGPFRQALTQVFERGL